MNNHRLIYLGWCLSALTFVALCLLALFAWNILGSASDRADATAQAQQASADQESLLRLHSLAIDTKDERAQLDALTHTDVVSIVNMIEAAGKSAGVNVQVSDALPVATPKAVSDKSTPPLQAVDFVLAAQGKFSALIGAIQLIENLPVPSSINQLDIALTLDVQGASTSGGPWHMSVRLRVLTSSDMSL